MNWTIRRNLVAAVFAVLAILALTACPVCAQGDAPPAPWPDVVFAPGRQTADGAWRTAAEGDVTALVLVALDLAPAIRTSHVPRTPSAGRRERVDPVRLAAIRRARRHLVSTLQSFGRVSLDPLHEALSALALLDAGERTWAIRVSQRWGDDAGAAGRPAIRWRREAVERAREIVAERLSGRYDRAALVEALRGVAWSDGFVAAVARSLPTIATKENETGVQTIRAARVSLPAYWCVDDGSVPVGARGRAPASATGAAKVTVTVDGRALDVRFAVPSGASGRERVAVEGRAEVALDAGDYRANEGAAVRVFGAGFVAQFERVGGFAGFDDRLELYRDGTLRVWSRGAWRTKRVSPERRATIEALIDGMRALDGVGTVKVDGVVRNVIAPGVGSPEAGADLMRLSVVLREANGRFARFIADDRASPPKVWIDLVRALGDLF